MAISYRRLNNEYSDVEQQNEVCALSNTETPSIWHTGIHRPSNGNGSTRWLDRARFALLGFALFFLLNQLEFVNFGVFNLRSGFLKLTNGEPLKKIPTKQILLFRRRPEVASVDCARVISGDVNYTEKFSKGRIPLIPNPNLDMSCSGIRDRVLMGRSEQEKINYSIAFARDVHEAYEYLEMQLAASYSFENHYCYSTDSKAPRDFQQKIRMLAACLPNVYTPPEKNVMDSAGHNINRGHYDCMTVLIEQPDWKYLVLQQTFDVVLHTHREMAEMFKLIEGTNDVEIVEGVPWGRINKELDWSLPGLGFITNNTMMSQEEVSKAKISFGKGYVQASLMRAAVKWITKEVNVEKLITQFNGKPSDYGVDEQFIATLQVSETLRMPGGFHHTCAGRTNDWYMTRYTIWGGECKTNNWRHGQCVFGIEDAPSLTNKTAKRFLMGNKFVPDFDFAGYSCINEWVFNKTRDGDQPFDADHIIKNPQARYNREKLAGRIDIYTYNCSDIPKGKK
ncbi:unnamed protein product, partial [Mesorhabditis belari]|uniref:Uncharacterized protein n=1 Tax=Mesorhabditis belari TaxID=2138241 RepID=A0AAF3F5P4_9BILA